MHKGEEERGQDEALSNTTVEGDPGGLNSVLAAGCCSAPQVGTESSHVAGFQVLLTKAAKEGCVVDSAECFRNVYRHCHYFCREDTVG